jgi:hypothetical protein
VKLIPLGTVLWIGVVELLYYIGSCSYRKIGESVFGLLKFGFFYSEFNRANYYWEQLRGMIKIFIQIFIQLHYRPQVVSAGVLFFISTYGIVC